MLCTAARLRTLIVAVLVSLVSLAAASGAQAATSSAQQIAGDSSNWQRAYNTALQFWGKTPCGGQVAISWDGLEREINALASWAAFPGAPAESFSDCSVKFNSELEWDYATFCSVVVHEVGHLIGHEHSDEPGNVMSHVTTTIVPACGTATARSASTGDSTQTRTITLSDSNTSRRRPTCRQRTLAKRRACRRALRRSAARRATNG